MTDKVTQKVMDNNKLMTDKVTQKVVDNNKLMTDKVTQKVMDKSKLMTDKKILRDTVLIHLLIYRCGNNMKIVV